ncbi:MAG: hypothetical protein EOO65_03270, partial [Methanosarcinales archaeon]
MLGLCATSVLWGGVCGVDVIDTVAGNGGRDFNGDGVPAIAAAIDNPFGVSALYNPISSSVVLYIADYGNYRIRRVDEGGIITTVAGNGDYWGFRGDGRPATAAALNRPYGVSALYNASSGGVVLYIADTFNNRIRRVDEGGIITTVAGNEGGAFSGDGGPATAATLYFPSGVSALYNASSGGVVLYIADTSNHRIRRVDEGGIITNVAGNGGGGFSGDGGPATAAQLSYSRSVSALYDASSGRVVLYIADSENHRIRCVDEGGIITTVAGNGTQGFIGDGGPATAAQLKYPSGVAAWYNASSGGVVLYIADSSNHRIRRIDEGGIITTVAGDGWDGFSGDGGPATAASLYNPFGVLVLYDASSGGVVLCIADAYNHRIRRVRSPPNIS